MPRKPSSQPDLRPGDHFGLLTVSGTLITARRPGGAGYSYSYPCRCACGREKVVLHAHLVRGRSRSCGCQRGVKPADGVRGPVRNRLRGIWALMLRRCENHADADYPNYGGRGIRVCPAWHEFASFLTWARAHPAYGDDLTIERVVVDGHYEPSNCTWIPKGDQARNRRVNKFATIGSETKLQADWLRDPRRRVERKTLYNRLRAGWDFELALTSPGHGLRETNRTPPNS